MTDYLKNIWLFIKPLLIIIDKAINVFFAPLLNLIPNIKYKFGYYKDTLSEVFGRNLDTCKFCQWICKRLGKFELKHCKKSIVDD